MRNNSFSFHEKFQEREWSAGKRLLRDAIAFALWIVVVARQKVGLFVHSTLDPTSAPPKPRGNLHKMDLGDRDVRMKGLNDHDDDDDDEDLLESTLRRKHMDEDDEDEDDEEDDEEDDIMEGDRGNSSRKAKVRHTYSIE
jgi:hypothetical protein